MARAPAESVMATLGFLDEGEIWPAPSTATLNEREGVDSPGVQISEVRLTEHVPTVPSQGEEKDVKKDEPVAITECAYLTDVEGNLDYFYNYIEISKVLEWENKDTKNRLKFKTKHTMLVFGGDSQDKGIGDIRFTKLLLDLKAQTGNEDRVEFIIGNRDANKLRLASELQKDCIDDPAVLNGMREYEQTSEPGRERGHESACKRICIYR